MALKPKKAKTKPTGNWFLNRASKNQQAKYLKSHPNSRYKKAGLKLDGASTKTSPPSSRQHAEHRADVKTNKTIKSTTDAKMKKGQQMSKLRSQLATFPPRPSDPKKAVAWAARKKALQDRIKGVRDSMRATTQRVMNLRRSR